MKLKDELDIINGSLIGGKNIDQVKKLTDVPTSNGRPHLFTIVKELYKFAEKVVALIPSTSEEPVTGNSDKRLEGLIKKQLTDVLPGLLQNALKDLAPQTKKVAKEVESKPRTVHTLLIEKIADNDDEKKLTENEWQTKTRKDVKAKLQNIKVINAAVSDGKAKLHFESKDHLDNATKALQEEYKVTSKSEDKKKMDPKLSISDIDCDIDSADLLMKEILDKDEKLKSMKDSGETLKVVYFHKVQRFAVIQISAKVRGIIRANGDRMGIGLMYYNVKDRYHVVQCYHCQEYGHISKECQQKGKDTVCRYCAGPHVAQKCTRDKADKSVKCSNCSQSKNRAEREACCTHAASDTLCPFYVRERVRVMTRTVGYEVEAKNAYVKKTQELRQRFGRM